MSKNVDINHSKAQNVQVKPNYILIAIGIILPIVLHFIGGLFSEPPFEAFSLAMAITFILYGLYPVPKGEGDFNSPFGKLSIVGPAAIGIFIFLFTWYGLQKASERRSERRLIVLQNVQDSSLNSFKFENGTTVRLLEVDSFSDDKIVSVLDEINLTLSRGGISDNSKRNKYLKYIFLGQVRALEFGSKREKKALELFDNYTNSVDNVDEEWTKLVENIAQDKGDRKDYIKRVKRQPFAIMKKTNEDKIDILLIVPGSPLEIGGRNVSVPVIANPSLKTTRNLVEAVVLQDR